MMGSKMNLDIQAVFKKFEPLAYITVHIKFYCMLH